MGIHHSPHTHRTPIPMEIPIPTAALSTPLYLQLLPLYPALSAPQWLQAEPSPAPKRLLLHLELTNYHATDDRKL